MDKSYTNGPGGNWNSRVRWYGQTDGRVKLKFETPERAWTETLETAELAQMRWDWFRREYPYQKVKGR